jgi:hypothetical protein
MCLLWPPLPKPAASDIHKPVRMPEKLLPRFEIQSLFRLPSLFYSIFLLFTNLLQAQVYITPLGAGLKDGRSWASAYPGTQLQNAITTAPAGSQLWVAAGVYLPNALPPGSSGGVGVRSYAFALKNGVALYGGFAGTETSLTMRNVAVNTTTLSGDIGVPGNASDNCYHVVLTPGTDNTAILDGFTIRDGNANGPSSGWSISFGSGAMTATPDAGGGLFCLASTSSLINN